MRSLLVGAAFLAFCQGSDVAAQPEPAPRWEYRLLTKEQVLEFGKKDFADGLNILGDSGWELAAVDGVYIFKRQQDAGRRLAQVNEAKGQITLLEADVEYLKDRVAWAGRMVQRGFMARNRLKGEQDNLKRAELALEQARQALQSYSTERLTPPRSK